MARQMMMTGLLLMGAVAAGCGGTATDGRDTAVAALTADTAAGKTVFTTNCAVCHGSDAKSGTARENLPSTAKNQFSVAVGTIINGTSGMPSFSSLTNQDIANVIGYLKTL